MKLESLLAIAATILIALGLTVFQSHVIISLINVIALIILIVWLMVLTLKKQQQSKSKSATPKDYVQEEEGKFNTQTPIKSDERPQGSASRKPEITSSADTLNKEVV